MTLRAEVSRVANVPPKFSSLQYNELTYGLLEISIASFAQGKGINLLDGPVFNTPLARKLVTGDDRDELVADAVAHIHRVVNPVLACTYFQYKFGFKILSTGNVLLGIDLRDLAEFKEETCED